MDKISIRMSLDVNSFRGMSDDNLSKIVEMIDQAADERIKLLKSFGENNIRTIFNMDSISQAVMRTRDELGIDLMEAKNIVDLIRSFR